MNYLDKWLGSIKELKKQTEKLKKLSENKSSKMFQNSHMDGVIEKLKEKEDILSKINELNNEIGKMRERYEIEGFEINSPDKISEIKKLQKKRLWTWKRP